MEAAETVAKELRQKRLLVRENEPLKEYTSFKIGGPAAVFCEPEGVEELQTALRVAQENFFPVYMLGNGTNVLFLDSGYPGMVVHIGKAFGSVNVIDGGRIQAGAGAEYARVCRAAQQAGLAGLEFAYGIPGSVGGAVFMNAGAYGGETRLALETVTYLDDQQVIVTRPVEELALGYRQSVFQSHAWYILGAVFSLQTGDPAAIAAAMEGYMQARKKKQPLDVPSAGSAFKRPVGAFAGALIDECGLRGYRVGDAAISEKHCGFIVNLGNATSADVLELAEYVVKTVQEKTGYLLEKEIRVVC